MSESSSKARLAVDIGGTCTDLAPKRGGGLITTKVPTTARPEDGVLADDHMNLEMPGGGLDDPQDRDPAPSVKLVLLFSRLVV